MRRPTTWLVVVVALLALAVAGFVLLPGTPDVRPASQGVADHLGGILTLLVLFVAMPLNWYVAWHLWRLNRRSPDIRALQVVFVKSLSIALLVTVFGLVFVNNALTPPPLNAFATQVITRSSMLILSVVPAVYWIRWYRGKGGH